MSERDDFEDREEDEESTTPPIPPRPPLSYNPTEKQLICAIETDTRENIDTKVFYDKITEHDGVRVLDKADVCAWVCELLI